MSRHASPGGEGLCRHQRLCRSVEFSRCYRRGYRRYGSLASLYSCFNKGQGARLGVTASRKVGNSVVRHRLKRRVREIFRRSENRGGLGSVDVVVHLKPSAAQASFSGLSAEIEGFLKSLVRYPESWA